MAAVGTHAPVEGAAGAGPWWAGAVGVAGMRAWRACMVGAVGVGAWRAWRAWWLWRARWAWRARWLWRARASARPGCPRPSCHAQQCAGQQICGDSALPARVRRAGMQRPTPTVNRPLVLLRLPMKNRAPCMDRVAGKGTSAVLKP